MGENVYFQKALSDFTYETAIGGAIRHLTDSGYTVRQIMEQLDFPASYRQVQKAVWDRLVEQKTILLESPGKGLIKEKVTYVREYDHYGRASFRRLVMREETESVQDWKIQVWDTGAGPLDKRTSRADFLVLLQDKIAVNTADQAYVSLDFGLVHSKEPGQYEAMLSVLDAYQREYVSGLPWEAQRVYHKLDSRGLEIIWQLYWAGQYQGQCYFLESREMIQICR